MRQILLMIAVVAVLGCGEKEPVQPSTSNPEATKPEPTKAKATAGDKLWEFQTGDNVFSSPAIGSDGTVYVGSQDTKLYALNGKTGVKLWEFQTGHLVFPPPPSALMERFTSGHMTTSSMPSRPIPKASPKARGRCLGRMPNTLDM